MVAFATSAKQVVQKGSVPENSRVSTLRSLRAMTDETLQHLQRRFNKGKGITVPLIY
jgi:hypothetical protein